MTLPHHRHITATGWALVALAMFWVGVALLLARCA